MKCRAGLVVVCLVLSLCALSSLRGISAEQNTNLETSVTHSRALPSRSIPLGVDFTATPNVAIPDNTYNGTLGSMVCSTINTSSLPPNTTVGTVTVQIGMSHTFVGDLTIKLISPAGSILGLVSRPGVSETADDGNDTAGFGENSNLAVANPLTYVDSATASAEQMGRVPIDLATGQTICVDGGTPCSYRPAPGTVAGLPNLAGFQGQTAVGNWQLCIADSAAADTGTFANWTLTIGTAVPTAAGATISGRAVTSDGRGLGNAILILSGGQLVEPRSVLTSPMGYYQFDDVAVGQTYILTIQSKQYVFNNPTHVLSLLDSVTDVDFIGSLQ